MVITVSRSGLPRGVGVLVEPVDGGGDRRVAFGFVEISWNGAVVDDEGFCPINQRDDRPVGCRRLDVLGRITSVAAPGGREGL